MLDQLNFPQPEEPDKNNNKNEGVDLSLSQHNSEMTEKPAAIISYNKIITRLLQF